MIKIKGVKAAGYSCIVEMLNEQELLGNSLLLGPRDNVSNHAYIKSVGPLFPKDSGVKEGDLVLLQSQYIPVPNPTDSNRKWGSIELHAIKAVLQTDE